MAERKTVTLHDFLTVDQIEKAIELGAAKAICDEIIEPNINEINQKLGQENDPMYLAYMTEYAVKQVGNGRS